MLHSRIMAVESKRAIPRPGVEKTAVKCRSSNLGIVTVPIDKLDPWKEIDEWFPVVNRSSEHDGQAKLRVMCSRVPEDVAIARNVAALRVGSESTDNGGGEGGGGEGVGGGGEGRGEGGVGKDTSQSAFHMQGKSSRMHVTDASPDVPPEVPPLCVCQRACACTCVCVCMCVRVNGRADRWVGKFRLEATALQLKRSRVIQYITFA
jgi:hypothetical protein